MADEQDVIVTDLLRSIRATLQWTLVVLIALVALLALWLFGAADIMQQHGTLFASGATRP